MTAAEFLTLIRPMLNEKFDAPCVITDSPRSVLIATEDRHVFKVTINAVRAPGDGSSGTQAHPIGATGNIALQSDGLVAEAFE